MTDILPPQVSALVQGINCLEPYIHEIHKDFNDGKFADWPAVFLATTLQSTAVSLIKLMPSFEVNNDILDKRSIATLVRNIIDTHDVMSMMLDCKDEEMFNLHRNILGMYLSGRISKIQEPISAGKIQPFYKHSKDWYWKAIKSSPLYARNMEKLRGGESVFYHSRRQRIESVCGEQTDFVSGILADISTYVHSIPPALWLTDLDGLYTDTIQNRQTVAIWLRIANFYFAQSLSIFFKVTPYLISEDADFYTKHHDTPFSN
ncbi:hypothetical protein ACPV30_08890 [Photobacterium damselae]|uniref:hypothetical protein n=1 Tax=Photobacterium damselae TaxID=38293 RepID=UPI004067BF98